MALIPCYKMIREGKPAIFSLAEGVNGNNSARDKKKKLRIKRFWIEKKVK
jgi:hypothetical protein